MTDSLDGSNKNPDYVASKLAHLRENYVPAIAKENVSDLPRWVKTALAYCEIFGDTYEEAAKRAGRTGKTLGNYASSPAGQKWRAALNGISDNPVQLAETLIKSQTFDMSLEYLQVYEAAKAANDYKEQRLIIMDWLNRGGVERSGGASLSDFKPTIVVNVTGGIGSSIDVEMSESEHTRVLDAEVISDGEE